MICPICNEELIVVGGSLKNIVPSSEISNIFPTQIIVSVETEYFCNTCSLTIKVSEVKIYIQES